MVKNILAFLKPFMFVDLLFDFALSQFDHFVDADEMIVDFLVAIYTRLLCFFNDFFEVSIVYIFKSL